MKPAGDELSTSAPETTSLLQLIAVREQLPTTKDAQPATLPISNAALPACNDETGALLQRCQQLQQ
jgi:hypothetical protein